MENIECILEYQLSRSRNVVSVGICSSKRVVSIYMSLRGEQIKDYLSRYFFSSLLGFEGQRGKTF